MIKNLIFIGLIFTSRLFGQDCIISFMEAPELLPKRNYFQIMVDNVPSDSIILTTDNGKIDTAHGCFYIVPYKKSSATIFIYKISGKDTTQIAKKTYNVSTYADHTVATISGQIGGSINKEFLLNCPGLTAEVINLDINLKVQVVSFRIMILRGDSLFYTSQQYSNRFSDDIINAFKLAEVGDKVYFIDIKSVNPESSKAEITLNDIKLKIK